MFERKKNKLWTQSATAVCWKKDHILVHIIVTPKDTLIPNIGVLKGKKEKSVFPLANSKALTHSMEKTMLVLRSDSPLNIQSI